MRSLVVAIAIVIGSTAAGAPSVFAEPTEYSAQKKAKKTRAEAGGSVVRAPRFVKGTRTPCLSRGGRTGGIPTFNRIYGSC